MFYFFRTEYFPELARQKRLLDRKHQGRRRNYWYKVPRKEREKDGQDEDAEFEPRWEENEAFEENEDIDEEQDENSTLEEQDENTTQEEQDGNNNPPEKENELTDAVLEDDTVVE